MATSIKELDHQSRKELYGERQYMRERIRAADERLQDVSGRLIAAQEEERRRIARDLHDDFSQRLALLSIDLERLYQNPEAREVQRQVLELCARAQEISSDVQQLSYQLHPSKVDQLGLVEALKSYCAEIKERHDLELDFTHRDVHADLPQDVALCFFRVAQEALRNIVRHSKAASAWISLVEKDHAINLTVSDTGIGFDLSQARGRSGLGLISMEERLRLVGGAFSIQSRPGSGTTIDVRVPLAQQIRGKSFRCRNGTGSNLTQALEVDRETNQTRTSR
jgi:signal transduction histidine kinase